MMTLYEKIISIYPQLIDADFYPIRGVITLQNDSDGKGDYIVKWEHPTLTRPTQSDLDGVTE
jgi:hypothetical protein